MTEPAFRPLTVGEILDQAFGLYRRYLPALVIIALVCTAVPQIGYAFVLVRAQGPAGLLAVWWEYLLLLLALVIFGQLAVGASTVLLSEAYLGRTISTGEALKRAWGSIGSIIGLSIATSLVIGLGLILLIIPGFILLSGLAVATPALMVEQGLDASSAMSRSWALTKGSRLRIFGMLAVTFLIIIVVVAGGSAILGVAMAATGSLKNMNPEHPSTVFSIGVQGLSLVVRTFLTPLIYCVLTVAYFDLRVRAEGFDLEMLAGSLPG